MLNDGSFQIFTARFRVRNPTGAAVNAITAGRTICTGRLFRGGKSQLLWKASAIDRVRLS